MNYSYLIIDHTTNDAINIVVASKNDDEKKDDELDDDTLKISPEESVKKHFVKFLKQCKNYLYDKLS